MINRSEAYSQMRAVQLGTICLTLTFAAGIISAQTGPAADGQRLYQANCNNCHGPNGDSITGVDLGHGKFRRASTDDELRNIIINGIPGTGMPPASIAPPQAMNIVAYLRSLAPTTSATGDTAHGKALFASKGCASCHRVLGTGSRTGPDLTEIGSYRRVAELETSLTDPSAEILAENRTFKATAKDGSTITGRVINEDAFTLAILDSRERLISVERADLRDPSYSKTSAMPSFKDRLTSQELADLVTYLSSLKRIDAK